MTMVGCVALPCGPPWMCMWAGLEGPAAQGVYNGPGDPGWCDFLVTNHQAGALAEPGPFWMPWFSMCILRAVWSWHACVAWLVVCVVSCLCVGDVAKVLSPCAVVCGVCWDRSHVVLCCSACLSSCDGPRPHTWGFPPMEQWGSTSSRSGPWSNEARLDHSLETD